MARFAALLLGERGDHVGTSLDLIQVVDVTHQVTAIGEPEHALAVDDEIARHVTAV
jgi:hypothetical protein